MSNAPTEDINPRTAARELAEALGMMFDDYPMASPQAPTLTLTITGHGGKPLQIDADAGQLAWLARLVEKGRQNTDRSHYDHPDTGVCAHCGQHADAVQN